LAWWLLVGASLMIARPHDALFKSAFEAPGSAGALLRELLPPALCDAIAWETLTGEPGSFIDAALADHHSDLLFSARMRAGDPLLMHLLLEHQSTSDPVMPLRTLTYETRIWDRFHKDRPGERLPPIIAVVISHVPGGWTAARSFEDLFDPSVMAIPGLLALIPRFSLVIADLSRMSNEDLKARSLAAFQKLALWLLRDARDPVCLLESFGTWVSTLVEVQRAPAGIDAFALLLTYMFRVVGKANQANLQARIRQMSHYAEETEMSIADALHEEGRAVGLAQGQCAALRRLLSFKFKLQVLDERYESRLKAATPEAIDRYLQRVLSADSLAAVFEG
jgi:predicted transposase/invertase (TIGR01784 family)